MHHFLLTREFHVQVSVPPALEVLRPPPRSARMKTRLGCEMLETREVPAVFNWLGTLEGGYSNPNNWYGGGLEPPKSGDDLYFGTVPQGKTISCVVPQAYSFVGVHVINGYTGTVTLQDNTTAGVLEVGSGTLAAGATLTATKLFSYVGGSITSAATPGIIHVTGTAQTGAAQAIIGSVSNLGCTVDVVGIGAMGAKLNLTGGTINTNNNSCIVVQGYSTSKNSSAVAFNGTFFVVDGTHDVPVNAPFTAKVIQVSGSEGVFNAHSNITTTGGSFFLIDGHVNVDGGVDFYLSNSQALQMDSGFFTILTNTASLTVKVNGKFTQNSGTVVLGTSNPNGTANLATLHITGKTELLGGKVQAADVVVATLACDLIECDNQIQFGASYVYDIAIPPSVPAGTKFMPFRATLGFVGTPIVAGYTVSTSQDSGGWWGMYITKN